jgi:uncharacterized protein (TIGR03067 family)
MADPGSNSRGTDRRGVSKDDRATERRGKDPDGQARGLDPAADQPPSATTTATSPTASLVGVWSHAIWVFQPNPSKGWTDVIDFRKSMKLSGLVSELDKQKEKFLGRISKLAIVAHGESGIVHLEPDLTVDNLDSFSKELKQLANYLAPTGKLLFMSCSAAEDETGTGLLQKFSQHLPGRFIIGFTIKGERRVDPTDPGMSQGFFAGDIHEGGPFDRRPVDARPFLTEDSRDYAKWVLNERLYRLPATEELFMFFGHWKKFKREPGLWSIITATANGKNAKQLDGAVVQMKSPETIELTKDRKSVWSGTFSFNHTKSPRQFDIVYTTGKDKGKTAMGLCHFDETGTYPDFDSLTICLSEPAGERPDAFACPAGSGRTLLDLKRAQVK